MKCRRVCEPSKNYCSHACAKNGRYDRMVDRCLQLIETGCGQSSIAELASEIGASSRQLTRRFQNAVGMSPKEFSRYIAAVCRQTSSHHCSIFARISSRIRRTCSSFAVSLLCTSEGSGKLQCIRVAGPGKIGHFSALASSHTVMT